MSRQGDGKTVVFTIVSSNYIAYAATLMQSVRALHPDVIRVIVLADTERPFPDIDLAASLIPAERFGIDGFESMATYYAIIELNTAIKPYVIQRLFEWHDAREVIYLDPDIQVFSPLTEVLEGLRDHSIVLTPHMMHPLQDGKQPCDHAIMKSGVYNFGFFACRADADAKRLVAWWADRCRAHCRVDIAGNMFTDQRWMDLAPVFVERPLILRHPGCNVAYWNLLHRHVTRSADGSWRVDGKPLVFFHFSGIVIDDPKVYSKYQDRFTVEELGVVGELCDRYRDAVRANGWSETTRIPYGFSRFQDGSTIEAPMRRWLLHALDEGLLPDGVPHGLTASFFDAPEDGLDASEAVVTRFMAQLWRDREDLRAAFAIRSPSGRVQYLDWFLRDAVRQGISQRSIDAAAAANGRQAPSAAAAFAAPPWPSIAELRGVADIEQPLERILDRDIEMSVGRQTMLVPAAAALAWENRLDLQRCFPLKTAADAQAFLAWALTDGVLERHLDPGRLSADFCDAWNRTLLVSRHYGDVPLTEGLLAVASKSAEWALRSDAGRFPGDRGARLAHGLWFAYRAPVLFSWPERLVRAVRDHFTADTDVRCGTFALTRGELAIWELRPDVQAAFPLTSAADVAAYLFWLATHGSRELGIDIETLDPRLCGFLAAPDDDMPEVPRFARLAHAQRADLREAFDLGTDKGRHGLAEWSAVGAVLDYADTPLVRRRQADGPPASEPPLRVGGVLVGYWSVASGRGEDVRCTHAALQSVGYHDTLILDLGSRRLLTPDGRPLSDGSRVEAEFAIVHTNADTAVTDTATVAALGVSASRLIGYWAWELEGLPARWRHAFACYDEIWASTRFAHGAFAREHVRPVALVPLAVHLPATLPPPSRADRGWSDDETVFLFIFDLRSYVARKNPAAAIAAFEQAFPDPGARVRLVIKTLGGTDRPLDLENLQASLGDPRIDLIDGEWPRDEILALVRDADCFVSLHRSEGFGRGPAEAMLLEKPVILTDYSGTRDFADETCTLPVWFDLVAVGPGEYPGGEGQHWADADVAMAADRMRWVHENPGQAAELGRLARRQAENLLAPPVVGAIIAETLALSPGTARRRNS